MLIDNLPVFHMVEEATHFSAASFLRSQSAKDIWKTIQLMWSLTYLGPPDYLSVDQVSAYISKEMRESVEAHGVMILEAPIKSPGTIGVVERYHAPLRAAYGNIRSKKEL